MIIKLAVICVSLANCLQFVLLERQRRALHHANEAIRLMHGVVGRLFETQVERKS